MLILSPGHQAFFVTAKSWQEAAALRRRIVRNPAQFNNVAQYISRLGLFCTADRPSRLQLALSDFELIDDMKARDGALVTDGAGYIRLALATRLFQAVLQIRPEVVPVTFIIKFLKNFRILEF